jgi:hypothetical protein
MTHPARQANPTQRTGETYRIRVAGALGDEWSGRTNAMTISVHRSECEETFTDLIGQLPDEAAVMGVLDALYTHGARLLRFEQIPEDGSSTVHPQDFQNLKLSSRPD